MRSSSLTLNTIALELVPPNLERGTEQALEDAHKVVQLAAKSGIDGRIGHVMMPGLIEEDDDRPIEMKPKLDVLDFWSMIKPELPGVRGLCSQVTAFMDEPALRRRLGDLVGAGIEASCSSAFRARWPTARAPASRRPTRCRFIKQLVANRGVILIPTRDGETGRLNFKCDQGATFAQTQLLYSDAIVGFLTDFAKKTDHRPEILLGFGFVPKLEEKIGFINWLIQDPGNPAVAEEQAFVTKLANTEPAQRRTLILDLYKRVIDGVADLGYPLSIHLEATYGNSAPAFETFAEMLDYWSPTT